MSNDNNKAELSAEEVKAKLVEFIDWNKYRDAFLKANNSEKVYDDFLKLTFAADLDNLLKLYTASALAEKDKEIDYLKKQNKLSLDNYDQLEVLAEAQALLMQTLNAKIQETQKQLREKEEMCGRLANHLKQLQLAHRWLWDNCERGELVDQETFFNENANAQNQAIDMLNAYNVAAPSTRQGSQEGGEG